MATLHLLRISPFSSNQIELCINTISSEDTLVLLDDGCYAVNHPSLRAISAKACNISLIADHANARGISAPTNCTLISLDDLVGLTFEHERAITWQ